MAVPKVFISSTCIDLKYIRSNLKSMIELLGYEPILSEYGKVFFDPEEHTHDSCINEIENCQLFVLIIGGRYGGKYKESEKSITIKEYEKALEKNIPIFTLVDDEVYKEHHVYVKNKQNLGMDINKIHFPSVDSIAIFDFIDMVRKQPKNNAIQPFSDFDDIENYIKNQFAGMFFSFLSKAIDEKKNTENVELIFNGNNKNEFLSSKVFDITDSDKAKVFVKGNNNLYRKNVKLESELLTNSAKKSFSTETWINPLKDLCLTFLSYLQKLPGGRYICFNEELIGTDEKPGRIIKEYHRTAIIFKKENFTEYLDHHKIAALYIRSFLKFCPFYLDVPENMKIPELCLYTSLSNEYFAIILLDTMFKAFSGNINKKLIIEERYKSNFIKILYHYKKDINRLDPLALANIIYLIEQNYFINT